MTRLRIPPVKAKPRDYTRLPWTEEYRAEFPTEKLQDLVLQGVKEEDLRDYLFAEKLVDYRKSKVLVDAYKSTQGIVRNDNEILLEINIPYCECKCIDCNRNLYQRHKSQDVYLYYFDALIKEIEQAKEIIKQKCYIVKSVCFTGNLLALDENELTQILSLCSYPLSEMCIELGNPKFAVKEKLDIVKKYDNVRFIVNALTFNTVTLRKLCRRYEFKDVVEYYKLIKQYGFDLTVNFVAGLDGERYLQVSRNLKTAIELGATCIDLYARNCKNNPKPDLVQTSQIAEQRKVLELTNEFMQKSGFMPYFLYCTEVKNGCFENIGYCLPNKKCKYMEDKVYGISTILGCGAETSSRIVKNMQKTVKTLKNNHDLGQYVMGIDEILVKKKKFFN